MKPWFFKPMMLVPKTSITYDWETGEKAVTTGDPIQGSGIIVPVGPEDIERGFQAGTYKCYCQFPGKPVVKNYVLKWQGKEYDILTPEFWDERDIMILQVRPSDTDDT
jgi:hypothetical protein